LLAFVIRNAQKRRDLNVISYLIWIDRTANTYKRLIEDSRSLSNALKQYTESLPFDLDEELSIRYEPVEASEVIL